MMEKICINDEIYALLAPIKEIKEGTEWFGNSFEALQASRMNYAAGKEFRAHKHVLNPRIIKRTQEAFVVISGKIQIDIFDDNQNLLGSITAQAGEAIFVYKGYHLVQVLEDAIAYEIKAGQYTYVSEDKEFLK